MRVVEAKQISFLMENSEEIFFNIEDITELVLEEGPKTYLKFDGRELIEVSCISEARFQIKAAANHTYNSFGQPSSTMAFTRLYNVPDVAAVSFYMDGSKLSFYVPEDADFKLTTDEIGNLEVQINASEEVVLGDCECDCCEECC